MLGWRWLGCALLLATGGCALNAPLTVKGDMCHFRSIAIDAADPQVAPDEPESVATEAAAPGTYADLLSAAIAPAKPRGGAMPMVEERGQIANSVLILSGGSEQGAFGAGFLDEWGRNSPGGHLPRFSLVTGISTGAILSTFAFVGDTGSAVQGYAITSEPQVLNPLVSISQGSPTLLGYVGILRKGAVADLAPLTAWLKLHIPETMVDQVAGEQGRTLMIGVVDVDTGRARALDMTAMARSHARAEADHDDAARQRSYDCYIKAIVASSSAPLAALPMFIDNRMVIDGGARFGMFLTTAHKALSDAAATKAAADAAGAGSGAIGHVFVIVNGSQEIAGRCGKLSSSDCRDGKDPWSNRDGRHAAWNFVDLAKRSEDILTNQVYRLSASLIGDEAKGRLHFIRIRDDADTGADPDAYSQSVDSYRPYDPDQPGTTPDSFLTDHSKTCGDWTAYDRTQSDPLQFFPHYMHCLIQYGRTTERSVAWERWR
jgi:hypothetical protein